jgi:polyphenol oxidase
MISVETPPGVRAIFTTREPAGDLGATSGATRPAEVRENRRALCDRLGLDPDRAVMGHQVHGAHVRHIDAPSRPGRFTGGLAGWPEGDGLATDCTGLALVVLGADCLPVLLWRRDGSGVAAAHAGWRGLVEGVVENAARALGDAAPVAAAIGPGIGACCYQTSTEVRGHFAQRFGDHVVHGENVDLAASARAALHMCGVNDDAITTIESCTRCEPDRFFSYRRDGAAAGRQAGVIWREA